MAEKEIVRGKPAAPEKEDWYRFQWKSEQDTPNRLEDAAKFLAFMITTSLSIFISVTGKGGAFKDTCPVLHAAILICWILSLLVSFFVFFPRQYQYSPDSIETFRAAHGKIVNFKRWMLILSLGLYFIALALLAVLFLL